MNNTKTTHLENVIIIKLDPHIWSGRKKLKPEDLGKIVADLPPDELASLGSKKIFDRARLAIFTNLHRAAERVCGTVGIKFLGGFAIPEQEAASVVAELEKIKDEFFVQKANFVQEYGQVIQDMLTTYPLWNHMLSNAVLPVNVAAGRINWDWDAMKVVGAGIDAADKKMAGKAHGMAGQLFEEISKEGLKLTDSLLGKEKVSRNVLKTVRNIHKKLSGLSFLDSRVGPIIQQIENTLALMPNDRPIEGNEMTTLFGLSFLLSDPERMKQHGEQILNGGSPELPEPDLETQNESSFVKTTEKVESQPEVVTAPIAEDEVQVVPIAQPSLALPDVQASEEEDESSEQQDETIVEPVLTDEPTIEQLFQQAPPEQSTVKNAVGWF